MSILKDRVPAQYISDNATTQALEANRDKFGLTTIMKLICLTLVVALASTSLTAKAPYTEKELVSYAKSLDVAKLDPTLSSQRLDQWLRFGPAHLDTVTWEMSDCDLHPDFSNPNYVAPLCVKVRFRRGDLGGWALIKVGTFRSGIGGTPHLDYIFAMAGSFGGDDHPHESSKLSELPRLLEEAASHKS